MKSELIRSMVTGLKRKVDYRLPKNHVLDCHISVEQKFGGIRKRFTQSVEP